MIDAEVKSLVHNIIAERDEVRAERDALKEIIRNAPTHLLLNVPIEDHDGQTYAAKQFHATYEKWQQNAESAIKETGNK